MKNLVQKRIRFPLSNKVMVSFVVIRDYFEEVVNAEVFKQSVSSNVVLINIKITTLKHLSSGVLFLHFLQEQT